MIRILHIVSDLSKNGGMISVIMNYYRNIDRKKVQFDFLSFKLNENDYSDEIINLGGRVYCLGYPKISIEYLRKINTFFEKHNGEYKAIHCHPIFSSEIFAKSARKNNIEYVIAHSHSTKFSNKKISALRNYFINLFVKNFATNYMACSEDAKKLFNRVNSEDIYILNNAIDYKKFKFNLNNRFKIRNEFNINDDDILIGNTGRLSSEKNQKFLLMLLKDICKINRKYKLMIVGAGVLENELKEYAKKNNIDNNVIFTGKRNDVESVLSAFDIFVLPSIFEGVPVSAIEAQAAGLQCILSNKVTKDVDIYGVKYLGIENGTDSWIKYISGLKNNLMYREANNNNLENSKYNIFLEAKNLEEYYINL
ncbi:glycosyltransferase [Clostridium perfringens]|uniref:Glycosyltransferase n=1 Tax=Clostridium perfringens TaxID=1502 RepID=A0AAW9IYU1_CLOPF|nr:glycosyltransferase [Clostridium perfringens]EJT6498974.1 glycosyltransferase [Clostridium perfringens]EJT6500043.1 glycosyltransferase [Clostridium perfringens]MDZ5032852.1 glycosyltransferase [Clostridium perfringens]